MKHLLTIVCATLLLTYSPQIFSQPTEKLLTLEKVMNSREFSPKSVRGIRPMLDGENFTQIKSDSINAYNYATGKLSRVIVSSDELTPEGRDKSIPINNYKFNSDETKILFASETESIYRRSSKSEYFIFDLGTRKLRALSANGKQQLADFSPDSKRAAFVRKNNIFITDLTTGDERQITFDGKINSIINGTTDWVYEEEFSIVKGFCWSPDGKKIAFMRFDESGVKEWNLTYYGNLYPELYKYKYPKAGEDNSIVSVHVYDLETAKTINVDLGTETDQYIPRIKFAGNHGKLAILRTNRLQNKFEILFADVESGASEVVYEETNNYYIEDGNYDNIHFLENEKHIVLTSERSGFNHIYSYAIETGELFPITSGNWDVTDLLGLDEKTGKVYYASAEVSPLDRNIYVVDFDGRNKKSLSPEAGTNSASFSAGFKYFIKTWSDANTPPVTTVNKGKNGNLIRVLENNDDLVGVREDYGLQNVEFFTITTSEGIKLNASKILPYNFDANKKYPVLFDIYNGPGSQTVRNNFGYGDMWHQYLAQEGIMVVSVDTRGTGARGEEFKKMTYRELGKYETIDMIEAAKYLGSLDYVDEEKIGIFGWSYGGYMSALCMTKGAEIFDAGIAVAPVTNWRYYDNIYTERFMRTPQENPDGYDDNSPINHVEKLEGPFLLVHGMADDNVHHQNSIDLITALVAADKDFDMMFYPNSNHGIYTGKNTRFHLYEKMTAFLVNHLK
ncbi:MAG: DPP IV N-terminal domain-containing protein [Bacteroidales bacterium]|nr:DPP IV N-terminal domain-containing protein [Bacteroidales bacterium]